MITGFQIYVASIEYRQMKNIFNNILLINMYVCLNLFYVYLSIDGLDLPHACHKATSST